MQRQCHFLNAKSQNAHGNRKKYKLTRMVRKLVGIVSPQMSAVVGEQSSACFLRLKLAVLFSESKIKMHTRGVRVHLCGE